MKKIDISAANTEKAKKKRALVAYISLIIASLIIYFIGSLVIDLFGFELETKIRDVAFGKALSVFLVMLPITAIVLYGTLKLIQLIFNKLKI
ncbi:hypothetical protein [Pseudoalteromonas piscicida]|uniref:Uncharacterized protein n=1 Tax=Pseudoalteromonas piscicida TaxID=43662 RepID=A0A2A5JJH6_PSEO7|nr:hypothetical protein [Pseudoalteromonas piscicida]PCK29603.1 hypothetical protein CEX98_21945 [Pseudoalteromonas piscicida]